MSDPVRQLEHTHGELIKLAFEVRDLVRVDSLDAPIRERLVERLGMLRDELLLHFAKEEEGLFPFLRSSVPAKAETVDRLESGHDAICGTIVRLAHLAGGARTATHDALVALYERFEAAFTTHSRMEAALFEELGGTLDARQRAALAGLLEGL